MDEESAIYPWETMTDEEFRDFVLEGGYLTYSDDGDALESLFARLDMVEDMELQETLARILIEWAKALLANDESVSTLDLGSYGGEVTLDDINGEDMFFRQEGSRTCTLAANAMLVRRAARLNGYNNWESITETALRPTCWIEGTGMVWYYSYAGINVGHGYFEAPTLQTMIDFLAQHPEGFVAYNSNITHAVVITDYTDGILYCGDPSYVGGRVPVAESYASRGSQDATVAGFTAYWFVTSPKLTVAPPRPTVEHDESIGLEAVSNDDYTITLTWNNTGDAGYFVYRADSELGPWTTLVYDASGSDNTTWTDTTGVPLKPYYYCVQPYDASHTGGSIYSNVARGIPDAGGAHLADGYCGNTINWAIYEDGRMDIIGSGEMYTYELAQDAPWNDYRSSIREIYISEGITSIGKYAFDGCQNLSSISIPTTVTAIGDWAFRGCSSLSGVSLPTGLRSIGYAAFRECSALQSIVIPENVSAIGDWAFSKCSSLTSAKLPAKITSIATALFYEDAALKTVNLPSGLTSIGAHAFRGCRSLGNVSFPSSLSSVGDYAFAMCHGLTNVTICRGSGLLTLGTGAFYNCTGIYDVTLTTAAIGDSAFAYCYGLRYVHITQSYNATSVGDYAFRGCSRMAYFMLLGGNCTRAENAFTGVNAIVLISNGSVGKDLEQPEGDSILRTFRAAGRCGGSVFWYLDANATLNICGAGALPNYDSTKAPWRSIYECIQKAYIEPGITGIGNSAFAGLSYLKNVRFAGSAPTISGNAFSGVTATVSYHDVDGSWDGRENQNYGGKLTWKDEHTFSWSLKTAPTPETTGEITGTCSGCGGTTSVELPRLDMVNYTCTDGVYTWNVTAYGTWQFEVAAVKITAQPASVQAAPGETVVFRVTAEGNGLTYRWQRRTGSDAAWADAASTASEIQVVAAASDNGAQYRCIITDAEGRTAESEAATLSVSSIFEILVQPVDQTVAKNTAASFTVVASGSGLKYQWQWKSSAAAKNWTNCTATTAGYNTATISPVATAVRDGYQYRCIITEESGKTLTSHVVTMTLLPSALSIVTQPADVTAQSGTTASFKVTAEGTGLKYQWQVRASARNNWSNCSFLTEGYNSNELKPKAELKRSGYQYRCIVKDASGNSMISQVVTLTVVNNLSITKQPENVTASAGERASFTVTATGTDLSYAWQVKSPYSVIWTTCTAATTGYNTATLQPLAEAKRDGYSYRCIITDAYGNKVTSKVATLTVE